MSEISIRETGIRMLGSAREMVSQHMDEFH